MLLSNKVRLCEKLQSAAFYFVQKKHDFELRHRITQQEVKSGLKLRNESCRFGGSESMCVRLLCMCECFLIFGRRSVGLF